MTPAELKAAREAANLRQAALAELAGITRSNLNHLEAGRRTIGPGMAARLKLALASATQETGR
jgi:transcriptional regulator with XRE-family HTH domain